MSQSWPSQPARPVNGQSWRGHALGCLTLFLLTAELGHSSRRDSEELCSSLHTCHRKWRKEPPAGGTDGALSAPGLCRPPLPSTPCPTREQHSLAGRAAAGGVERKPACGPGRPGVRSARSPTSWVASVYQMGTGILPTSQASVKKANTGPTWAALRLRAHTDLWACWLHVHLRCQEQGTRFTPLCSHEGPVLSFCSVNAKVNG